MKRLLISPDLKLPYEAVTQTFGILAMRGVGKTYTASVMAEEFSKAGLPFAVLDPTGVWYGLRSSADGKREGYPVMIIGGDHGDAPLEEKAGTVIADMLVEDSPPLVIDLSRLSKSGMRRFVETFAERLYQKNREPLHLIIDEADAFAPQKPEKGELRMLGAIDDIVRRGRNRGLGCTLVTQRSAVLNKDVLTQTEVLIVLRTAHPRDRAPVLEWMKANATSEQLRDVEASLAKLPLGDAWVMSAGWLNLFKRIHVRKRHTFNSSATPKLGKRRGKGRAQPRARARIDPEILQKRLAAAIERQQATDPAALRRQITELKRQIAVHDRALKKKQEAPPPQPVVETVEVPVVLDADFKRFEDVTVGTKVAMVAAAADFEAAAEKHKTALDRAVVAVRDAAGKAAAARPAKRAAAPPRTVTPAPARPAAAAVSAGRLTAIEDDIARGSGVDLMIMGERRILITIAQHAEGVTRKQVTTITGYKRSTRDRYIQLLRGRAFIADDNSERITVTETGIAALGSDYEPLPTGPALLDYWRKALPSGQLACLEVAVASYPEPVDRETITDRTGYKRSTRDRYLQLLKSRFFITEPSRGMVRASDTLF